MISVNYRVKKVISLDDYSSYLPVDLIARTMIVLSKKGYTFDDEAV